MNGVFCFLTIAVIVIFIFLIILGYFITWFPGATSGSRKKHSESHPGLTKNGKDVICPKCKSPYCQYFFEERPLTGTYVKSSTKIHPLNPMKPFVEDKYTVIPGQNYQLQRFRCTNCGYIFD